MEIPLKARVQRMFEMAMQIH